MNIVERANTLFNEYQTKMDGVSPDLKESIQNEKKQALKDEYRNQILEIVGDIKRELVDLTALRGKYEDPTFTLALDAVSNSTDINMGDSALINAIPGLPGNMLDTIVEQSSKAGVKIALLNQAIASGNADLKKKVLRSVTVPMATIKGIAAKEKACLETLFKTPEIMGYNGPAKLAAGHQINDLNKILTAE